MNPKNISTKTFFDQKILLPKNMLTQNIFWSKKFFWPKILTQPNFLDQKIFTQKFFLSKNFLTNFFWLFKPYFVYLNPKNFLTKKYFYQKICWPKIFFGPNKIFLTEKIFTLKFFLSIKIFDKFFDRLSLILSTWVNKAAQHISASYNDVTWGTFFVRVLVLLVVDVVTGQKKSQLYPKLVFS